MLSRSDSQERSPELIVRMPETWKTRLDYSGGCFGISPPTLKLVEVARESLERDGTYGDTCTSITLNGTYGDTCTSITAMEVETQLSVPVACIRGEIGTFDLG